MGLQPAMATHEDTRCFTPANFRHRTAADLRVVQPDDGAGPGAIAARRTRARRRLPLHSKAVYAAGRVTHEQIPAVDVERHALERNIKLAEPG